MAAEIQSLPFTGDDDADRLLVAEPLALLIGTLLQEHIPKAWAFHSPLDLKERMGGRLDVDEIANFDPGRMVEIFLGPPALSRSPTLMAARTQELCRHLAEHYAGKAERSWTDATTGEELLANLVALPGFGDHKARRFLLVLAEDLGVTPPGWEEAAGDYVNRPWYSVATRPRRVNTDAGAEPRK